MVNPYFRKALSTSGSAPSWAKGLRNAIGISLPLIIGIWMGHIALAIPAALGAYLVAFSDDEGGAFPPRLRSMALCAVASAVSFAIGVWAQPWLWLSVLLVIIWTFAWGVLAGCGRIPSVIGSMSATAILVATSEATATEAPLAAGAAILSGGLFVVAMTLVAWPFATELPARRELAAAQAAVEAVVANCLATSDQANEKARQKAIAAIAAARKVVAGTFPEPDLRRAELLAQLRAAERSIKFAAALRFEHRSPATASPANRNDPDSRTAAAGGQRAVGELLAQTRAIFVEGVDPALERTDHPLPATAPLSHRLKAALNPSGNAFAYALRFTIVAAAGLVLAALTRIPHASWVSVTSWRVLRPSYSATMTRAHQRVLGNVLGGVLAAVLLWVAPADYILVIIIGTFAFLCFALRPVNYGFYAIFATVVMLMLIGLTEPDDIVAAVIRIGATVVGALLAVLGARFVLPRWTTTSALTTLTQAMSANRAYAQSIAAAYRGRYDREEVTADRRQADAANNNAYSMLDQIRHEPVSDPHHLALIEDVVQLNLQLRDCLVALASRHAAGSVGSSQLIAALTEIDPGLAEAIDALNQLDPHASSIAILDLSHLVQHTEALLVAARRN